MKKYLILIFSVIFLCALAVTNIVSADVSVSVPTKLNISFANNDVLNSIRQNPSSINATFVNAQNTLRLGLGSKFNTLNSNDLFAVYSSIIAYNIAPYGNSVATKLSDLLKEPMLDCDNYALLTTELFSLNNSKNNIKIHIVGWDSGAVGNHAQLFLSDPDNNMNLLIDPTVGVIAIADFNQIASGKPVSVNNVVDYSSRTELQSFRQEIIDAIENGKYKPSDLLYYFEDTNHFLRHVIGVQEPWPPDWPTPGAMSLRARVNAENS
ncbi:hypothetical protein [Desulfosporosinus fructosivorans]